MENVNKNVLGFTRIYFIVTFDEDIENHSKFKATF